MRNPAFDVTPAELVTALITEQAWSGHPNAAESAGLFTAARLPLEGRIQTWASRRFRSDRHAAAHFDDGTVDVAGFVGGEQRIGVGDLLRPRQPPQRDFAFIASSTFSGMDFRMLVSTKPGQTALARMPLRPNSRAQVLTMPITPNLLAA